MDVLTFFVLILGLAYSLYIYSRSGKEADTVSIPPGPKPLPLIGNIFDLTVKELWVKATSLAQTYGPVFQLSILHPSLPISQPLIFLSSPEVCFDLLDKKGGIYADKPKLVMAGELCGCDNMVAFTGYGSQSRRQRKLLGMALSKERIPAYQGLIERETAGFLTGLLSAHSSSASSSTVSLPSKSTLPSRFLAYIPLIRRYAGQLTLSVIYGYTVPTSYTQNVHDKFLDMAEDCVDILSNRIASGGGIWLVDIFPWLKKAPKSFESLPLFSFLPKSRAWKAKMIEFVEKPFEWVKAEMQKGTHVPSFCSTLLENPDAVFSSAETNRFTKRQSDISPELLSSWASVSSNVVKPTSSNAKGYAQFEFDLKWTANSMYSASGDTTVTTVMHYFLALLQDADSGGEVVRKARMELDLVTGLADDSPSTIKPRLPSLSDRYIDVDVPDGKGGARRVKKPRFPYVEAVMSEVWRWGVVVPLNLPHRLTQDDVYTPPPSPSNPHPTPVLLRKGSLVFGNIWSILRSNELFGDDVDDFRPERYLLSTHEDDVLYGSHNHSHDEDEYEMIRRERRKRDPRSYVFGFGRRQCPGQNLVESSVWLLTATLLSTVDVRRPCVEGEDGKERVVRENVNFNNSVFRTPDPFGVDIRPRSEKALEVIMLAGESEEAESL
ncbi:cytochrome P450 [Lentinula boryana]|uniref:Cytochrome P450 n=1 Tax=Lentinula boryana TaxID=40481 RepID=A0ABQ8Q898_9AGAR|nr:cytochrome P450 [Lentinula boryana]